VQRAALETVKALPELVMNLFWLPGLRLVVAAWAHP